MILELRRFSFAIALSIAALSLISCATTRQSSAPTPSQGQPPTDVERLFVLYNGTWDVTAFNVTAGKPVAPEKYVEVLSRLDKENLKVESLGIADAEFRSHPWKHVMRGDELTLSTNWCKVSGRRTGNMFSLKGQTIDGRDLRIRLYFIGDKIVFQSEIWVNEMVYTSYMAHLVRRQN